MQRRGFLTGLAGILAAGVAPAIVTQPMKIWVPKTQLAEFSVDTLHPLRFGNMTWRPELRLILPTMIEKSGIQLTSRPLQWKDAAF